MKILVGMSGGVDSSVAAWLLKQSGYEVIGATMDIWDEEFSSQLTAKNKGCFASDKSSIELAKSVCQLLDIPHYVVDCRDEYKKKVLANFREEYKAGRTPNPCIVCNSNIKFSVLPDSAKNQGIEFDKFATGHYAQIFYNNSINRYQIKCGVDDKKDQSYFLYRLSQEQLKNIVLPLGEKNKQEIRLLAQQAGLGICDKPDSQDFYGGKINDILQFEARKGDFVDVNGHVLGKHDGYWNFTIGQRRGLGISAPKPLYVIDINKDKNEVVLGYIEECQKKVLLARNWVWQSDVPHEKINCVAKIRSSQKFCDVEVTLIENDCYKVEFLVPQSAITAGQSVVLYDNNIILGGGIID